MLSIRFGVLVLAIATLGGCGGTISPTVPPISSPTPGATAPSQEPVSSFLPTPGPTPVDVWPVVRSSCSAAVGDPRQLVAIGTSESDDPGEFPELYADILCADLGAPVELHRYFPTRGLAPLAYWIDKARGDPELRADLAAADVIVLWAMSSHDIVPPLLLNPCRGSWPDPLRACFDAATADIVAETDELFGLVADLVGEDAIVLAGDAYVPPAVVRLPWFDEPYGPEISRMVDPYYVVEPTAAKYGFTVVDTELAYNGPGRRAMPDESLFVSDGLHPSPAGSLRIAQLYAEADGIGG
jgi:hypothetical protein